jgi:hypothetical protein
MFANLVKVSEQVTSLISKQCTLAKSGLFLMAVHRKDITGKTRTSLFAFEYRYIHTHTSGHLHCALIVMLIYARFQASTLV